jgi:hypothetical protein
MHTISLYLVLHTFAAPFASTNSIHAQPKVISPFDSFCLVFGAHSKRLHEVRLSPGARRRLRSSHNFRVPANPVVQASPPGISSCVWPYVGSQKGVHLLVTFTPSLTVIHGSASNPLLDPNAFPFHVRSCSIEFGLHLV